MSSIESQTHTLKDGTHITLRTAAATDVKTLLDYEREIIKSSPHRAILLEEFRVSEEDGIKWIAEHLSSEGSLVFVAEHGQRIIGLVSFKNGSRKRLQHRGELDISVAHAWRNKGVGTVLLRALLNWARANPIIENVALFVVEANASAIALYRKMGFIEEGRRVKAVKRGPGHYDDHLLMYLWVK